MEQITRVAQILRQEVDELLCEEELMHIEYYSKHGRLSPSRHLFRSSPRQSSGGLRWRQ